MSDSFVKNYESVCNRCGGVGTVIIRISYYRGHKRGVCPRCKGTGRLDWIERITGEKRNASNNGS